MGDASSIVPTGRSIPGFQTEFRKLDNPEFSPGCYSLDLYCDHENPDHSYDEFPHQFIHESGAVCRRAARRRGWKLHADNTATCPKCMARLKGKARP